MAVKMNFDEGLKLVDSDCLRMFEKVNSVITKSMTDDCVNLLTEFPYEYLRKYLNSCYSKMADNLQSQVLKKCQEWAAGEGGFAAFAKKTMNSAEAIQYAKTADATVEKYIGDYLSNYQMYVQNHLSTLRSPSTNYDNGALDPKLKEMISKPISDLTESKEKMTSDIRKQMEENRFMSPLLGVTEILYRHTISWYQSILKSVPSFITNADAAIDKASNDADSAAAAAAQEADAAAEDMPTSVEL